MRKSVIAVAAVVVVLGLILWWVMWSPEGAAPPSGPSAPDQTIAEASPTPAPASETPAEATAPAAPVESEQTRAAALSQEPDEEQGARLFGRVFMFAQEDIPVMGAKVYLVPGVSEGDAFSVVEADGAGNYEFRGVEPGNMRLLYAVKEHLYSTERTANAERVLAPPGEAALGPYDLKMRHSPVLTVRVVSSLTDEPMQGVKVEFFNARPRGHTTDEAGEVTATVTPEIWNLRLEAEGYVTLDEQVDLAAGGDRTHEVVMSPGGAVYGTVTTEGGDPVQRVNVRVQARGGISRTVRPDESGAYRIEGLPFETELALTAMPYGTPVTLMVDRKVVLTAEAPEAEANFTVKPVERVETADTDKLAIAGQVVDEQGEPIARAIVMYGQLILPKAENYADEEGRFLLTDITPQSYQKYVTAFADGYAAERVTAEAGPISDPPEVTITLEPGHWVKGRVVDSDKRPIARARITPVMMGQALTPRIKHSDAEGKFEFDSLSEGTLFRFSAQGYSDKMREELELDTVDIEVVMLPQGLLAGRVVDADSGEPIANFRVKLGLSSERRAGDPSASLSMTLIDGTNFENAEGYFEIDNMIATAPYRVSIEAEGYPLQSIERVVAQARNELEPELFELSRASLTIAGAVATTDFQPVAGAEVTVLVHSRQRNQVYFGWPSFIRDGMRFNILSSESALTNDEGAFFFEDIPLGGPVDLIVISDGFANTRVVEIEAMSEEERAAVIVNLARAGRILGTVNREVYDNVTGLRLSSRTQNRPTLHGNSSLQNGETEYEFAALPSGKYTLTLSGYGRPSPNGGFTSQTILSKEIALAEGEELRVDLGEELTYVLSGSVRVGQAPLSGGLALLRSQGTTMQIRREAEVDAQGSFSFTNIQPGKYQFIAIRDVPSDFSNSWQAENNSPFKESLEVVDADVHLDFVFPEPGRVHGRVVNLPEKTRYIGLSNRVPEPDRLPVYKNVEPGPDGSFLFEGVPEGLYQMTITAQGGSRRIRDDIAVPSEGADVDLGEIVLESGGAIRVTVSGDLPRDSQFGGMSISLFKPGATEPLSPRDVIGSARIPSGETSVLIEDVAEGPVRLSISAPAYRGDPPTQVVQVIAGETVEVAVVMSASTMFVANCQIGEARVEAVVGFHAATGETVRFEQLDPNNIPINLYSGIMAAYMVRESGGNRTASMIGSGLSPGLWRIGLTTTDGQTWFEEIELELGKPVMSQFTLK